MASISEMPILNWTQDNSYLISTDPSLIPLASLNNDIFGADDFNWGKPLPPKQLHTLVHRSLCFGLYELEHVSSTTHTADPDPDPARGPHHQHQAPTTTATASHPPLKKLIGFARLITDLVSVNYLTDVYILPAFRSQRLGIWLMSCVDEVFQAMPQLRGMILITDRGSRTEEFYRKYLGMGELAGRGFCMDRKGRGA